MDTLPGDLRQAWRLLAGNRVFAAAAIVTVAVSVGGTAALAAVVHGVLLRPLPYPEPHRLVRLWEEHPRARAPIPGTLLSHPTYRAWSGAHASLEDLGAFRASDYIVSVGGAAQRFRGTRVTPSIFRLLRISPAIGRLFTDADADRGAPPVVVLGHAVWRDRFGGDPAAVGRTLVIDEVDHEIVGVAPPDFAFPQRAVGLRDDRRDVSLYTPFVIGDPEPGARVITAFDAIGRLRPGITIAQAEAEGVSHARSVERPLAELVFGKGAQVEVRVRSLADQMTMSVRPALLVLSAGVVLVLAIACANLANLFLSRGHDRGRELAVRAALGADRRRLVRQLLSESILISLIGGGLGLFVGWMMTVAVRALAPADFPRLDDIRVDGAFVIVAALVAVLVGAISGAAPAIRASRVDLSAAMQAGSRSAGPSSTRLRRGLLVLEAGLAIVLLIGASLLARSFARLVQVDAGYEPAHVLTADLHAPRGADGAKRTWQLAGSTVERLRTISGVRAAGAGEMAPFGSVISGFGFSLPGLTTPDGKPVVASALRSVVTPGYAEAIGMRLLEGRFFRADDTTSAIRAMLVNEAFKRTYLTDGRAVVGRRFTGLFPRWLGNHTIVEIVGVVRDVLPDALDARTMPQIFVAYGQSAVVGNATLVVKTDGDPAAMAPILEDVVHQLEPQATLARMGPLAAKRSASVGDRRLATFVLGSFAVLALALAATGLYGALSYNVSQRRREIGVRAALGATRSCLLGMVLREGLVVTVIGLVAGLSAASLATRAMAGVLFGVTPLDPIAFSVSALLLLAVACAACLLPARRAASADPADVLRTD